jgi:hypothetical protein
MVYNKVLQEQLFQIVELKSQAEVQKSNPKIIQWKLLSRMIQDSDNEAASVNFRNDYQD